MIIENFEEFNNNFCVYIYFDPRKPGYYGFGEISFDFEPIYVGKGKYNSKNNLTGPNRVSLDGILNKGFSKNFTLISTSFLNR